jgi:molybdenum cofactor cytidylyltransferase
VTVVAGAHPAAVRASLTGLGGVRVIDHPGWAQGPLSPLLAGLDAVAVDSVGGVLVALVDSPLVRVDTVGVLIDQWRTTRAPVVRPAWGRRHGHPVIFERAVFAALRGAPFERGAKTVIAALGDRVRNVAIDDPGIVVDVDTPERLAALGGDADT